MGLRDIGGDSRTDDSAEAVEAEQDGLGGAVSMLTGAAVILGERREFSCAAAWSGVLLVVFRGEALNRHFFSHGLTIRDGET